jgi:hypothetical protein
LFLDPPVPFRSVTGLDDETLMRLGRIAVTFSSAEFIANHILWMLVSPPEGWVGPRLAAGESIDWVLTRIERLAPYRVAGADLTAVNNWVVEMRRVKDERNGLLHSTIGWDEEESKLFALSQRRGETKSSRFPKEQLARVEGDVVAAADTGFEVMVSIGRKLVPEVFGDEGKTSDAQND